MSVQLNSYYSTEIFFFFAVVVVVVISFLFNIRKEIMILLKTFFFHIVGFNIRVSAVFC